MVVVEVDDGKFVDWFVWVGGWVVVGIDEVGCDFVFR